MQIKKRETLNTDILIIGGGTAGCYAALIAFTPAARQPLLFILAFSAISTEYPDFSAIVNAA